MVGDHGYQEAMGIRRPWVVGYHGHQEIMGGRRSWVIGDYGHQEAVGSRRSWASDPPGARETDIYESPDVGMLRIELKSSTKWYVLFTSEPSLLSSYILYQFESSFMFLTNNYQTVTKIPN